MQKKKKKKNSFKTVPLKKIPEQEFFKVDLVSD